MAEIVGVVLYYYEWQNVFSEALNYARHAGFEADTEVQASGDIHLSLILPPGVSIESARQKIINLMNMQSVTLYFDTPTPPVIVIPPPVRPVRPWWEALEVTDPKTTIYAAKAIVEVYRTITKTGVSPDAWDFPGENPMRDRVLVLGAPAQVWRKPAEGDIWICVYDGPAFGLWARGAEMAAVKPA